MILSCLIWFVIGGAAAIWFLGSLLFWVSLCATLRAARREKREPITKAMKLNPRLLRA